MQASTIPHATRQTSFLSQHGVEGQLRECRRRILFPTDFGPASQRAWPYAVTLAQALSAELVVLHVLELAVADSEGFAGTETAEGVEESLRRAAEGPLEHLRAEAAGAGVAVRTQLMMGRVRAEIRRVAVALQSTLIVMGIQGHRGWRPALRSIAEWVAAHVSCPVVAVWYVSPPVTASEGSGTGSTGSQQASGTIRGV